LSLLNLVISKEKNEKCRFGQSGSINRDGSRNIFVIPTNEEYVIAMQTDTIVKGLFSG